MTKHKAVVKGIVNRLYYTFGYYCSGVDTHKQEVEKKTIWSGELDLPFLKDGELLYIEELDITVQIVCRVRSTSGEYVYFTDHEIEVVEDEVSQKSKENAEEANRIHKEKRILERNKKWYQKLFK